jgi:hypothetical protein
VVKKFKMIDRIASSIRLKFIPAMINVDKTCAAIKGTTFSVTCAIRYPTMTMPTIANTHPIIVPAENTIPNRVIPEQQADWIGKHYLSKRCTNTEDREYNTDDLFPTKPISLNLLKYNTFLTLHRHLICINIFIFTLAFDKLGRHTQSSYNHPKVAPGPPPDSNCDHTFPSLYCL